jgi:hypothetical protein
MNSASLCSLAGQYDNPIPTWFLAPIDCLKIPAQSFHFSRQRKGFSYAFLLTEESFFLLQNCNYNNFHLATVEVQSFHFSGQKRAIAFAFYFSDAGPTY